jgi:glycosyltransferase involved in cell wall biosynthesis
VREPSRGRDSWPSISAALIVRDEERFLTDCLASIAAEVDEIVVVDTGSKDATREIALGFGARLIDSVWTGDFSAARNLALEHASSDFILYIDADERLWVPKPGGLRIAVAAEPNAVAFRVLFSPRVDYTPYRELRVFRRDPRIRFRGVIHETVHPDLMRVAQTDCLIFADADIRLDHVGYEGDLTHKHQRNLPLLEEAVKASPERVFLWVDMAHALQGLGRSEEAEQACWAAIGAAEGAPGDKQSADEALAWHCLVSIHIDPDPDKAVELGRRGLARLPESLGLRLALAKALYAAGEAETVPPLLDPLVAIDAESFADPLVAYDKRLFGEWAHDLLGAAYVRMGRLDLAASAFASASALAPDNLAYRAKAAAFAGASAKPQPTDPPPAHGSSEEVNTCPRTNS